MNKELISQAKAQWEFGWKTNHPDFYWLNRDCPEEIKNAIETNYFPQKGSVVDIGCGQAEIAAYFSKLNYEVDAFDIAPSAIEKAKLKNQNLKINFYVHDIVESKLPKEYDILIDRGCLHTIHPALLKNYAQHIIESTKSNGKFCVFIRAFRGTKTIKEKDEEVRIIYNNIQSLFAQNFNLDKFAMTNLASSNKNSSMLGVVFFLSKR